jgi:hypothetical protein
MKTAWSILSALAIGNLLTLAGFRAWLVASDRMDCERARAIRAIVQETVPDARARTKQEAELAQQEAIARELTAQSQEEGIPITADGIVRGKIEASEMDLQRINRMRQLVSDLQEAVRIERESLTRDREDFDRSKLAFEAERARIAEIEGAEQFQTALSVYEGLRPDAARNMLAQLLAGAGEAAGSREQGEDLVVAYLNAMQDRQRNKIIAEFEKDDPALAAGLLERLRTRGIAAAGEDVDAPGGP